MRKIINWEDTKNLLRKKLITVSSTFMCDMGYVQETFKYQTLKTFKNVMVTVFWDATPHNMVKTA